MQAKKSNKIFTSSETENIVSFYATLKRIHERLISQGYIIENGKIIPPTSKCSGNNML